MNERGKTMSSIKDELKAELEEEFLEVFIERLDQFGDLDRLEEAIIAGDNIVRDDIMADIRQNYRDWCQTFEVDGWEEIYYGNFD